MKWLLYGHKGWIGLQLIDILEKMGETVIKAESRADDEKAVEEELLRTMPDQVVSSIGKTHGEGINTIDYLEKKGKLVENLKDNLYAQFVLAMLCTKHNIHLSSISTGCIYSSPEEEYGDGYMDDADPDFFGSSYSVVKGFSHRMMKMFKDNVLSLKIRMPITADRTSRNFITKITTYSKICSIENSMSVLPELLPIAIQLAKDKQTGPINLCNPNTINHNTILQLYKEIVDNSFTWQNFTYEEQSKILACERSNNKLNTDKLQKLFPNVLPIKEAVIQVLHEMKKNMNK